MGGSCCMDWLAASQLSGSGPWRVPGQDAAAAPAQWTPVRHLLHCEVASACARHDVHRRSPVLHSFILRKMSSYGEAKQSGVPGRPVQVHCKAGRGSALGGLSSSRIKPWRGVCWVAQEAGPSCRQPGRALRAVKKPSRPGCIPSGGACAVTRTMTGCDLATCVPPQHALALVATTGDR